MSDTKQRKAVKEFVEFWKDKGYEKGESQTFWLSLLRDVFEIEHPERFISFEDKYFLHLVLENSFISFGIYFDKIFLK